MSNLLKLLTTDAGLAEVVNAEASGTAPVVLSHIAFGTGQYTPTANMTALKSEFKRFDSVKGGAIGDNVIHISLHDNSKDIYSVYEVGVFTESGTLFAVYSQTTPIVQKADSSDIMLVADFVFSDIDASNITIGDTNFILNPATTETKGIVELATETEAKAGTDSEKAITPKTLDVAIEAHDNIVHKSGAEAINGYKCFVGDVGKRNNNADVSTTPENNTYSSFDFSDKNNKKYASVVGATYNDGDVGAILAANRTINGVEYHSQIHVRLDDEGTPYATAPTPASGDNSTKIATTAFVNTKANNYLPLAGGTMQGIINCNGKPFTNPSYIEFKPNSTNNGGYLDFHYAGSTEDYTSRIIEDGEGRLTMVAPSGVRINNKNLVQSVNNTNADANGNVAISSVATATSATKATQDGNGNVIADTYLPVSGGKMTATRAITRDVNDSYISIHGGTGENNDGAQADFCGANHSSMPGGFQIHARNSENDIILRGLIDGTLTWNSKTVLTNSTSMPNNSSGIVLNGGTDYESGAYIRAYGKDNETYPGWFTLGASDGTNSSALRGLPDGTLTWNGASLITPTGAIFPFAGSTAPSGFLICDGSAISRTTYADLFAVIGTTYGTGDGSTTFNLPNLIDKFIQGSATVGTVKEAGLPNIKGTFAQNGMKKDSESSASGALYIYSGGKQNGQQATSGSSAVGVGLDASKSSSIYGKSTTVQPPALTMLYCIKY